MDERRAVEQGECMFIPCGVDAYTADQVIAVEA